MRKIFIVVFIITIFSSSKCNKDETLLTFKLPEKTQVGANTFGFLLNTTVWTNYGQVCFITGGCHENLICNYHSTNELTINADRVLYKSGGLSTSESVYIYLDRSQPITIGKYTLGFNGNSTFFYVVPSSKEKQYYPTDSIPSFYLEITKLDTVNKIVSGGFYGKLFNYEFKQSSPNSNYILTMNEKDSILIKDGRFDLKYK